MRRILATLVLFGCSGGGGDPAEKKTSSCPPLEVKLGGAPLAGLGAAFATRFTDDKGATWQIELATGAPLTCDELLAGGRRHRMNGPDHLVGIYLADTYAAFTGVRFDMTSMSRRGDPMVTLVGAPPTKPGDPLALCVTDAKSDFKGGMSVEGLVTATYCGERAPKR
jgi:hypothetical protein